MRSTVLLVLLCTPVFGQPKSSGPAETKGSCSPANTGNNNIFNITCGIGREKGEQILKILNRILESQLDPAEVIARLDEILRKVDDIKQFNADRRLSDQQKQWLLSVLQPFEGEKVTINAPQGDAEAFRYAEDFASVFEGAGLQLNAFASGAEESGVNQIMTMGGRPVTGVNLEPKDEAAWHKPLVQTFDRALTMVQIRHSAQYSAGLSWTDLQFASATDSPSSRHRSLPMPSPLQVHAAFFPCQLLNSCHL